MSLQLQKGILNMIRTFRKAIGYTLIISATAAPAFAAPVPEIDPGSMVGAMALLSTGLAMIMDRRRSK